MGNQLRVNLMKTKTKTMSSQVGKSRKLQADSGSFRDVENKVYSYEGRILRGLSKSAVANWEILNKKKFFQNAVLRGDIVKTKLLSKNDKGAKAVLADGWDSVLEHTRVPFISYPYEWTISMLRDAALLHLDLIERAVRNGWTLKDATAYNIQFIGAKPVFIDIVSFEPRKEGEPWYGYRQFCMMFLIPLMMRAHLGLDHTSLLRSNLEGIEPGEAAKVFRLSKGWKKGVLSHVILPSMIEGRIAKKERDDAKAQKRDSIQSKERVIALLSSMRRTVKALDFGINHTTWSHYEKTHSYDDIEFSKKKEFVERNAKTEHWKTSWDIGCNTGTFSKLIAPYCDQVISLDGDHNAVEQLYLREQAEDRIGNLLPLTSNLANLSPNQGWGGSERKAFDEREKPDLVLVLALIHHVAISANIPMESFLDWLLRLDANIVLEFVTREDDMVKKLLINKTISYADYNLVNFEKAVKERFKILDSDLLKDGHRKIFFLEPK